jgi:glycosyltransferase involved in cell wall biosynthesis
MRVLHVVSGNLDDGATRGALWLHRGLLACGVESRMLLPQASTSDPSIMSLASGKYQSLFRRLRNKADNVPKLFYPHRQRRMFSVGRLGVDIARQRAYAWADLVNLHWINNGMVALGRLPAIGKPLVWTLRDMWPFTGGCHYAMGCERYVTGCGACPQLGSCSKNDLSAAGVRWKRRFVPKATVVVGISRWIGDCARASAALGHLDIRVILNNVDTDHFFPVSKAEARARLGLPADARIVLSGSLHPSNYYKGYDLWQAAVAELQHDGLLLALAGRHIPHPDDPAPLRTFGLVRDDAVLRDIYAAADVFILPSRQEAFGKTGAEALACGTPVVAFDATGPRDIVVHRQTGYLARPFVVADLVAGVRWVLADGERARRLSAAAAEAAPRLFGTAVAAAQYRDLYREMLDRG